MARDGAKTVAALDRTCRMAGGKPGTSPDLVRILDLTRDNLPDYVVDANNHVCPGYSTSDGPGAVLTLFVGGPANSATQALATPVYASRIEKYGAFDHLFVSTTALCGKPDAPDPFDTDWRRCRRPVTWNASSTFAIGPRPGPSFPGADAAGRTDPSQPFAKPSDEDLAKAVRLWTIGADRGDVRSMLELGDAYANGRGVQQDHARALSWYRKVAEAGDASKTVPGSTVSGTAMFAVGLAYEKGLGVRRDEAEAANWFARAAKAGAAIPIFDLAMKFEVGRDGVERSLPKALFLYRLAADAGYPMAMYTLAAAHIFGRPGLPPDRTEGALWLHRFAGTSAVRDPMIASQVKSLFAVLEDR